MISSPYVTSFLPMSDLINESILENLYDEVYEDLNNDGEYNLGEPFTDQNNDGILGDESITTDNTTGIVTSGVDGYTLPINDDMLVGPAL